MNRSRPGFILWVLCGILFLEYIYIFSFLLNYHFCYMQEENIRTGTWALGDGKALRWDDWARSLNIDRIELDPYRITRPISDFCQVLDAKFRANCWNFIPPHPALSLYWPLYFIGIPLLMFRFFRNMGCYPTVSLGGVCLYLSSIGFLGPILMFFHPGKGLVNFLTIWSLFLTSLIYREVSKLEGRVSFAEVPHFGAYFAALLFSVFMTFFCDETGLFVFAIIGVFWVPLFLRLKEWRMILFCALLLPLGYFLAIHFFLPYLHLMVRGVHINLGHCEMFPHISGVFLQNLCTNYVWLFADYPHLYMKITNLITNKPFAILQLFYISGTVFVLVLFFKAIFWDGPKSRLAPIAGCMILLILFVLFHTILMSSFGQTWGVWYYGSLFPLIYYVLLVLIMQFILEGRYGGIFKNLFIFIIAVTALFSMISTTCRFDQFHANHQVQVGLRCAKEEIFGGDAGEYFKQFSFKYSLENSHCRYLYTVSKWSQVKQKKIAAISQETIDHCKGLLAKDMDFIDETKYLDVEL